MRCFALVLMYCLALAGAAHAGGSHTYWPGFTGQIGFVGGPLDASLPKNRYLSLTIALGKEPTKRQVVLDSAFHAVCQRHRAELLRMAKSMSPDTDWRVQVRFQWQVPAKNGVSVTVYPQRTMRLSNCRIV